MSTFERDDYRWRETFFVAFQREHRPATDFMVQALQQLSRRYELLDVVGNDDGQIESLTVQSPADYAALDISYVEGEEVLEEGMNLAKEMEPMAEGSEELEQIRRLSQLGSRFDVLHFEKIDAGQGEDGEMLDPSAMLAVVQTLATLTQGVAVDPQSGTVID